MTMQTTPRHSAGRTSCFLSSSFSSSTSSSRSRRDDHRYHHPATTTGKRRRTLPSRRRTPNAGQSEPSWKRKQEIAFMGVGGSVTPCASDPSRRNCRNARHHGGQRHNRRQVIQSAGQTLQTLVPVVWRGPPAATAVGAYASASTAAVRQSG